jgi:hypothetical protein
MKQPSQETTMTRQPQRPLRNKSDAELQYILKDASEAARAMRGYDSTAEAKYLDQINDASTELYYRRNA